MTELPAGSTGAAVYGNQQALQDLIAACQAYAIATGLTNQDIDQARIELTKLMDKLQARRS